MRVIEEVMKLINEFMRRVEKHRDVLLSESTTPFDNAIASLNTWLMSMEGKVKETSDEGIIKLRRAMIEVGRKMLTLAKQAREKWLAVYRKELEELIEGLRKREVKVIINGEPFNNDKSFMAHLNTEHITIEISRMARNNSTLIVMRLTGLDGVDVVAPKLLDNDELKAMQYGLLLTDGSIDGKGYPEMDTTQLWQVITFTLVFPGKVSMGIHGININDGYVSVIWCLWAIDHKDEFRNKIDVAEKASKLNDKEFLLFTLFLILGDGNVDLERKMIGLTMGKLKRELWGGGVIERLRSLGFKENNNKYLVTYTVKSSKAIDLARKMLNGSIVKAFIEDLSKLSNAEKLKELIVLPNMRVKPRGRSSIEVIDGIKMNVHLTTMVTYS